MRSSEASARGTGRKDGDCEDESKKDGDDSVLRSAAECSAMGLSSLTSNRSCTGESGMVRPSNAKHSNIAASSPEQNNVVTHLSRPFCLEDDIPGNLSTESSSLSFKPSMADSSLTLPSPLIEEVSTASVGLSDAAAKQAESTNAHGAATDGGIRQSVSSDPSHTLLCSSSRHELGSLINVGHLMRSSVTDSLNETSISNREGDCANKRKFYQRDVSVHEKKWDEMTKTARATLDVLGHDGVVAELQRAGYDIEGFVDKLPAIPPAPPVFEKGSLQDRCDSSLPEDDFSKILSSLPAEFSCPLCGLLIVGAAVLNCGCSRSTFCSHCIDKHLSLKKGGECSGKLSETVVDGYVIVDYEREPMDLIRGRPDFKAAVSCTAESSRCPSCNAAVKLPATSCHALDVAILNGVCSLSSRTEWPNEVSVDNGADSTVIQKFQSAYFVRFNKWREDVLALRAQAMKERELCQEQLLGALIQAEEEKTKKVGRKNRRTVSLVCENRGVQFLGEVIIMVAAAAATALLGIRFSSHKKG